MVWIYPNSGAIPFMLGLYPTSSFFVTPLGMVTVRPKARHCVLCSIEHALPPARLFTPMHVSIPYKNRVYSCLPKDETHEVRNMSKTSKIEKLN